MTDDKNIDNIIECEGVPNGVTPANVGGMGAIALPGECGLKGSGDLPSPSGKVYNQILPFDSFIKSNWKKKKRKKYKKPNTPDSPYYEHSPNPDVYKYVYDFKQYMDKAKEGL